MKMITSGKDNPNIGRTAHQRPSMSHKDTLARMPLRGPTLESKGQAAHRLHRVERERAARLQYNEVMNLFWGLRREEQSAYSHPHGFGRAAGVS